MSCPVVVVEGLHNQFVIQQRGRFKLGCFAKQKVSTSDACVPGHMGSSFKHRDVPKNPAHPPSATAGAGGSGKLYSASQEQ